MDWDYWYIFTTAFLTCLDCQIWNAESSGTKAYCLASAPELAAGEDGPLARTGSGQATQLVLAMLFWFVTPAPDLVASGEESRICAP